MGCGPSSGCAEVLNSRWSTWLGIPAGAIGALDYLVMFAATLFVGAGRSASVRGRAWAVLVVTAVAAAGAAIWFVFLQFEVLGDWCKYCLTVHACGLVAAGLVFWRVPAVLRGTRLSVAGLVGLAAVCALVFGQLLVPPKSYQIQTSRGPTSSASSSVTRPSAGSGRHSPYGAL